MLLLLPLLVLVKLRLVLSELSVGTPLEPIVKVSILKSLMGGNPLLAPLVLLLELSE